MATMNTKLLANPTDPSAWQQALDAFLAEKEGRSGSRRAVESYCPMLQELFGQTDKTPDVITPTRPPSCAVMPAGESFESVPVLIDHSALAVTTV
jgi:hypothetical protein